MRRSTRSLLATVSFLLAALLAAAAAPVAAQQQHGSLYGPATDTEGNPLPGVTVTIQGPGGPQIQITNANGAFRFLGLDPAQYPLTASLDGFSTVDWPNVTIGASRNTTLQVELEVSPTEEVIVVTSESRCSTKERYRQERRSVRVELEKIPTARDPWSVLAQTPGVLVDRINVGGNESGQSSFFRGPGVSDNENSFLVDGVEITDMANIGASPTYYDFDQFTEIQLTTGGTDVTKSAAGVSVNLITKRGTNEFRGSARFLVTDDNVYNLSRVTDSDLGSRWRFLQGRSNGHLDRVHVVLGSGHH